MLIVLHASVHLSRGSSLLGGVATELLGGLGLDGALRAADGGGAGNGSLDEIGAVAGLADLAGDGLVGPIRFASCQQFVPCCCRFLRCHCRGVLTCGQSC